MAGDNVKGVDYRMVGRMALSAMKRKQSHAHFSAVRTSTTYNFMWTRLTFSEEAAEGFGVICKAAG
jgi:hypothetical protein